MRSIPWAARSPTAPVRLRDARSGHIVDAQNDRQGRRVRVPRRRSRQLHRRDTRSRFYRSGREPAAHRRSRRCRVRRREAAVPHSAVRGRTRPFDAVGLARRRRRWRVASSRGEGAHVGDALRRPAHDNNRCRRTSTETTQPPRPRLRAPAILAPARTPSRARCICSIGSRCSIATARSRRQCSFSRRSP